MMIINILISGYPDVQVVFSKQHLS